jgi:hypothetical protein
MSELFGHQRGSTPSEKSTQSAHELSDGRTDRSAPWASTREGQRRPDAIAEGRGELQDGAVRRTQPRRTEEQGLTMAWSTATMAGTRASARRRLARMDSARPENNDRVEKTSIAG